MKASQVNDSSVFILLISKALLSRYILGIFTSSAWQGEKLDGLLKEEELHVMPETNEFQNRWEVSLEGESPHI